MKEFISQVGPLFWIMSIFAIYGMAVVIERLFYFHRVRINSGDFLRGLSMLVRKGAYAEAEHEAAQLPGPTARVVESIISRPHLSREDLGDIAQQSVQMEVFKIERNIRGLLVVATVSPLLGLLGTVLALMKYFVQPGVMDGKTPTLELTQAMYEALFTSAIGISMAIPAYLFYMYLTARARLVVHEVERAGIETIHVICDARKEQ